MAGYNSIAYISGLAYYFAAESILHKGREDPSWKAVQDRPTSYFYYVYKKQVDTRHINICLKASPIIFDGTHFKTG